jgi:hypothetical protein
MKFFCQELSGIFFLKLPYRLRLARSGVVDILQLLMSIQFIVLLC